jgi:hypothetical protein
MLGLGPSGAIRGATFDCGFFTVDEVVEAARLVVLLGAFFCWLGSVPHPAKPMPIATMVIPVLANLRFIALAPVGRALRRVRESTRGEHTVNHRVRRGLAVGLRPVWRPSPNATACGPSNSGE